MKPLVAVLALLTPSAATLFALDASDFDEVVGYVVAATTKVSGEFNGADHGKLIKLDNGMIFEFSEYSYSYAYRPACVIFAKVLDADEIRRIAPNSKLTRLVLYKLLIDDEFYDARRIR